MKRLVRHGVFGEWELQNFPEFSNRFPEFSRFRPRHSKIVFEKCQATLQNFYLPFPPLSYGRLRLGSPETLLESPLRSPRVESVLLRDLQHKSRYTAIISQLDKTWQKLDKTQIKHDKRHRKTISKPRLQDSKTLNAEVGYVRWSLRHSSSTRQGMLRWCWCVSFPKLGWYCDAWSCVTLSLDFRHVFNMLHRSA